MGVRVRLTRMADVVGYEEAKEDIGAIPDRLLYRGIDVLDLVNGKKGNHFGYEEVYFLLSFGYPPRKGEPGGFCSMVRRCYKVPDEFVETSLLCLPRENLVNKFMNVVLTLYNYDDDPDNTNVY